MIASPPAYSLLPPLLLLLLLLLAAAAAATDNDGHVLAADRTDKGGKAAEIATSLDQKQQQQQRKNGDSEREVAGDQKIRAHIEAQQYQAVVAVDSVEDQSFNAAEMPPDVDDSDIVAAVDSAIDSLDAGRLDEAKDLLQSIYDEKQAREDVHANATYYLGLSILLGPDVDEPPSKYQRAKDKFIEASELGHTGAQSTLGFMYSAGFGIPKDQPLSLLYYYFASIGGDASASMVLGYRHMYGIGVPKSCEAAVRYYMDASVQVVDAVDQGEALPYMERRRLSDEKARLHPVDEDADVIHYYEHAADGGDVNAQVVLGHLHQQGVRGVERSAERASAYFHKAAELGDASALAELGQMYANGIGVAQNNATAYHYFRKAADLGHATGFYGLGFLFLHGQGVEKSVDKAVKFFKKAAELGSAEAQFSLGTLYYTGVGVDKSYVTAIHYFTAAGHQGHTTALFNLAQMHLLGLGTIKSCSFGLRLHKVVAERGPWTLVIDDAHKAYMNGDYAKALLQFGQAAEMGIEIAQANVGWLLEQPMGYYEDDHHHLALHYWRLAADQGNADAQRVLGDYYYYGRVHKADFKEAARRYRQAADRRNAQAMFNMGYMHQKGLGVPRDLHLAKRYYDLAIDTASEAYVPASLAIVGLRLQQLWDGVAGIAPLADSVEIKADLHDQVGDNSMHWENILLTLMCAAFAIIVYMRQHRLN